MANDFDKKGRYRGRVARQWQAARSRSLGTRPQGLSGAALEQAVFAIAAVDPSLVKIQGA